MRPRSLPTLLAISILLGQSACLGRPSLEEASDALAGFVEPAVKAGFANVDRVPEPITIPDPCGDAIVGPSEGIRPTRTYLISVDQLRMEPQEFLRIVEDTWRDMGAEVRVDDTSEVMMRLATRNGNRARALVNLGSGEVRLGGSGPCVDDPNR